MGGARKDRGYCAEKISTTKRIVFQNYRELLNAVERRYQSCPLAQIGTGSTQFHSRALLAKVNSFRGDHQRHWRAQFYAGKLGKGTQTDKMPFVIVSYTVVKVF